VPELPDVEVFKQYLDATALHQKIESVDARSRRILTGIDASDLDSRLQGHTFEGTRRHGKYLFVELDDSNWLMLHFGMTGSLKYYTHSEDEPRYTQILFHFANGYHLAYVMPRKLGEVQVMGDPDDLIEEKGLGPDVLTDQFDFETFREILGGRRGMIKSRLMDQQIMAGVGNVYSDEILFQAGVHPRRKMGDLKEETLERIFGCLKEVLNVAIAHRAQPEQFPDNYLTRHRGTEHQCPCCGGPVERVKVAGRAGYFCPRCQGNGD